MPSIDQIKNQHDVIGSDRRLPPKDFTSKDFWDLFLAQLKAQDPMQPFDSNAMLQQMSQLGTFNATSQLEKTVKTLNSSMSQSQVLDATQLIGKKVQLVDKAKVSPLVKGQGLGGSVVLDKPASAITVTIKDNNNHVVKTIKMPASPAGVVDFEWDGKNEQGELMSPDFYHISATAMKDGKSEEVPTAGNFVVNSVALNKATGDIYLNVDGLGGVKMSQIVKILNSKERGPWV